MSDLKQILSDLKILSANLQCGECGICCNNKQEKECGACHQKTCGDCYNKSGFCPFCKDSKFGAKGVCQVQQEYTDAHFENEYGDLEEDQESGDEDETSRALRLAQSYSISELQSAIRISNARLRSLRNLTSRVLENADLMARPNMLAAVEADASRALSLQSRVWGLRSLLSDRVTAS